ncbi:MAG: dipeptidase [Phycisphaerales bacterium]|nr:dipeptidase [Phycisphaerales bacterium]
MDAPLQIIDGHNDTLTRLFPPADETAQSIIDRNGEGHIDLIRAQHGGLAGGFFAVFIPGSGGRSSITANDGTTLEAGCFDPVDHATARAQTNGVLDRMDHMLKANSDRIRLVRTAEELDSCMRDGVMALILHYEGVEMFSEDLSELEVDHARGLRSLGPVWSRSNAFAHGVPFAFPCTPDIGPGLTNAGKDLVRRCNDLGVMLDVSHLNYRGFMDLSELTTAPVIATHCGVHAICASSRNLLDDQLDVIRGSNGLVGVNFHVGFLRPDGEDDEDTPLSVIADHLDYMVDRMGIEHVALGSDFDGATMPEPMGDCAGLPTLVDVLRDRGWCDKSLHALAHGNWMRVLRSTWG